MTPAAIPAEDPPAARSGRGDEQDRHRLVRGVGRAFGGALLFSVPMLMTMELWEMGDTVDRFRLGLLVLTTAALVFGLARVVGAGAGPGGLPGHLVDTGVALLVAAVASAVILIALAIVHPIENWNAAASVVAIETLPAAIGAAYARSQLGQVSR